MKKAQAAKAYERQQQEIGRMEDFIQRVIKLALQRVACVILELSAWRKWESLEKPKEYIKPSF